MRVEHYETENVAAMLLVSIIPSTCMKGLKVAGRVDSPIDELGGIGLAITGVLDNEAAMLSDC
jgi:hypothetical protein